MARKKGSKKKKIVKDISTVYEDAVLDFNPATGYATFMESRILLIRPETLVKLMKSIEEKIGFDAMSMIMYEAGKNAGIIDVDKTKEFLKRIGITKKEIPEIILKKIRLPARLGYCYDTLVKHDKKANVMKFKMDNSFIASFYGMSKRPVCHLLAGHLAGTISEIYGKEYEAIETKCLARGDMHCIFDVMPKALYRKKMLEML